MTRDDGVALGALEGARSATGSAPSAAVEVKRWSSGRKKQVVLRMLRGESVDALSRELGVPIVRLEEWRDRALAGIDVGLKERDQAEGRRTPVRAVPSSARDARSAQNDPVEKQLDDANWRIGELVMEAEILRKEREARCVFHGQLDADSTRTWTVIP